jgi:ABC-type transport system involved in cytochrome c biogenesis ATPase subunit
LQVFSAAKPFVLLAMAPDIFPQSNIPVMQLALSCPTQPDVTVTPLFDPLVFVKAAVKGAVLEPIVTVALTAARVLLFPGNRCSTLIIALTMPLSILAAPDRDGTRAAPPRSKICARSSPSGPCRLRRNASRPRGGRRRRLPRSAARSACLTGRGQSNRLAGLMTRQPWTDMAFAKVPAMPTPSPTPVLQVQCLHFAHPGQPPLFTDLSLDFPAGLTLLDGDTGSGKTTLLRLLAGELRGASGRFALGGRRNDDADPATWCREVCWIDPRDPAWDALTPGELMAVQRTRHPGLMDAAWQRHQQGFDLAPHLGKAMFQLSTGSRRKVALAAALSAGATLTLLDEPAAGLDKPAIAWLAQALAEAAAAPGRAWLIASAWGLEDRLPLAATVTL